MLDMTEDEKKEIEQEVFHRLQVRVLIIGIPLILGLLFTFAQIVEGEKGEKGEKGDPGATPFISEIVKEITIPSSLEIANEIKKDRKFVESVRNEIPQLNKHSRLDCELLEVSSGMTAYPSAEAVIPQKELDAGYHRIAGGCRVAKGANGIHVITFHDQAIKNGWKCMAANTPHVVTPTIITAQVVYCRITN